MRLPRRYRLLVCAAAVLFGAGWIGSQLQQARAQQHAVDAITKLGGRIYYDYHRTDTRTNLIDDRQPQVPQVLLSLFGAEAFGSVVEVNLSHNRELSNADLVHLQALPHLKTLFVCGGSATGDALKHLCNLHELEDLTLGIPLNDDDLRYLASITTLKEVYLLGPRPGDFMVRFRGPTLIYDEESHNSQVTNDGIQELAARLPGCRITY